MEIHVFDFDGTIFYSPAPNKKLLSNELGYGSEFFGALSNPLFSKGYGWFQSLSTMSPPAVPELPAEKVWYVQPILRHIHWLAERRRAARGGGPSPSSAPPISIYVMTGRDEKFRQRIEDLLRNVGLLDEMEGIYLKPTEEAGTIKYKLNTLLALVWEYQPSHLFYYEDRFDQGGKIYLGMEQLAAVLRCNPGATRRQPSSPMQKAEQPFKTAILYYEEEEGMENEMDCYDVSHPSPFLCRCTALKDTVEVFDSEAQCDTALRWAQRWMIETVSFWNKREKGEHFTRLAKPSGSSVNAAFDAVALRRSILFGLPTPFDFSVVLLPPSLTKRSEMMLSAAEVTALISRLTEAKAKYDTICHTGF